MFPSTQGCSFSYLSDEKREALISLLEKRNEYCAHTIELNRLRIEAIANPSAATVDAVEEYSREHMLPLRVGMMPEMELLLKQSINTEQLQTMLPMVLAALAQAIDMELLLTTMGADADMIAETIGRTQEFFRRGM